MMLTPLHELLSRPRAAQHPVCHDGERFVPWCEFAAQVLALTEHLKTRPESRWLLASDAPLDFAVRLFALWHAGKQVVIPPNTQPGTLAQLAHGFDAEADRALSAIPTQGPGAWPQDPGVRLPPLDPDHALLDLYTSGSTGEPKRIRKTLSQFSHEVAAQEALWGLHLGQAVIVATVPHHHIYGLLFRLFWPLAAGRPFDALTCSDPSTLAQRLALLGDTALVSSPAQLSRLPELVPLASLAPTPRIVFSSGGPLPASTAAEFARQLGQAPIEVFGSTETGGIAWRQQHGDDSWTPLPGIGVARETDGALSLSSPFLLTHEQPWRMDDEVELLAQGRFRLRGRLDRVVKIEEKRLSLPDMEARLAAHPWIAAAGVVALTGRRASLGAAVVLTPQGRLELTALGPRGAAQSLRQHLAEFFEPVLLPRRWRFPLQLPLNERGKLTQAALAALFTRADDEPFAA